ncbi:MAG: KamA family radical SAM protein [Candidatus Bipolaricaulota bacterium]
MVGRVPGSVREVGLEALWREDPALADLLEKSETIEAARVALRVYLNDLEAALRARDVLRNRIERAVALDRIGILKELLSPENETLAQCSLVETLWRWAHEPEASGDISPGFIEEVCHLLRAVRGETGLGRGWLAEAEEVSVEQGLGTALAPSDRRRARRRSIALDGLADHVFDAIARFPCGLDEPLVGRRVENRRRVQASLGATNAEWDDGRWQMEHVLKGKTGARIVGQLVSLSREEEEAIDLAVTHGVPWGITPYYLTLFDMPSSDRIEDGQVRSQVIPPVHTVRAMIDHRGDRKTAFDFMREGETSPADGVTRRYAEVAILKLCDTCPQICTYCQRNWEIEEPMAASKMPTLAAIEPALRWFAEHPEVVDVLITGGDPLVATDDVLRALLERLAGMSHVQYIRIGTRVPVTAPTRVTEELAELLGSYIVPGRRDVVITTHVESPYEVTPELAAAVSRLRNRGVRVYNQQVFTFETSRRFQTVANRLALKRAGIDPYYTFYTKGKDEHRDYLVPVARLLQERKEEARLLPGMYRTDESVFNVPGLGKHHLRAAQDREWIGLRADGRRVYLFHPWEKGIAPVPAWPYVDVSIAEYLDRLAAHGENVADYESIWYYS